MLSRKIFLLGELLFGVFLVACMGIPHAHAATPSIYLYPTNPIAPRGTYQTVTAIIDNATDKTVTWSAPDGGTIVGTNPCVVNAPCTAALYTTTPGTYRLIATSNANSAVTATSHITITGSPTPITGHPRLMVTAAMLPGLQAKASAVNNTIFQQIKAAAVNDFNNDNAIWSWSCNNGTGLPSTDQSNSWKQGTAYEFAFMALIDPNDPTYNWGCYGRDEWVYVMNQVLNGNTQFGGNYWSDDSPQFAFTTDWLMGSNSLSPSDITLAHKFLADIAQVIMNAGQGVTSPIGNYNSTAQFVTPGIYDLGGMRAMGNNYTEAKFVILTGAALTFDDNTSDDPALSNTCNATRYQVCPDGSAGSLHAYWTYLTGAMMYREYAHMEDPAVSWQAYQNAYGNLPSEPMCESTDDLQHPCFGDGAGGESSEGSGYNGNTQSLRYALNAIYTAGYDDPILYGPQLSLESTSWWDVKAVVDNEFLTPGTFTDGAPGPAYSFLITGDTNQYYRQPADFQPEAALLTYDSYTGRTDRKNILEWPILNTAFGGAAGTLGNCSPSYYCGFDNELLNVFAQPVAFDMFISLPAADPVVSNPPSDPRPALPTDLYNAANQHIMVRNNFSSSGTLFSYYCPNTLINHEHEFCGRFDIFSNGDYITKGLVEFNDYNDYMSLAKNQNIVAIKNVNGSSCANSNCFAYLSTTNGGQFWSGIQAGPVVLNHAELSTYVSADVDDTNLYNGAVGEGNGDYNDVQQASRSLIYLRNSNEVVYYDRAVTGHNAYKQLYLNTTGPLTLNGNSGSWPTRSGSQTAYFTSLLPAGAIVSNAGLQSSTFWEQANDWEPYTTIEVDAGTPTSTRFLSVLQWGSSGFTKTPTTLIQSTGGMNFDGALVGSSLIMFMRTWPSTLTSVTYPASGATTQYVSDLLPNTTYDIAGAGTPSTGITDSSGVLVFSASGSGIITVSASGVTVDTTPPTTAVTSPANNASVAGTVAVTATASDNVGVASVALYIDGTLRATDSSSPYSFSLDTTSLSNGTHTIYTKAYDAAGNVGTSPTITITVSNTVVDTTPPSVPTNLTVANITSSTISLSWTASTDNVGVTGYNIYRGGVKIGTANTTSYVSTGLSASTTYSYTVSAYDAAGNTSAQTGSVSGTTSGGGGGGGDTTPPTTAVTSPANNASVAGTVAVTATASDNVGVASVALYIDGTLRATDSSSPYSFSLDTTSLSNGTHTIYTKAYDAAGNVGTSPTITITVSNTVVATTTPPSGGGGGGGSSGGGGGAPVPTPPTSPTFEITSVSENAITQTSAQIAITTHAPASVVIKYGITTAYGKATNASPLLSTSYENLTGLTPNTVYDFIVIATPSGGTAVTSENYTFKTLASVGTIIPPTRPPGTTSSTTPTAPVFVSNIAYGDTSSEVLALQNILYSQGFLQKIYITGYFGTQTEHALLLFQSAHDLNKSGFVDAQTQALLNKIAAAQAAAAGTTTTTPITTTTPPPSTQSTGTLTQNLGPGSTGSQVTVLQHILNTDGDYPAAIYTTFYGTLTENAVKLFQTQQGIISYGSPYTTGYGAVGPKTREKLNEE